MPHVLELHAELLLEAVPRASSDAFKVDATSNGSKLQAPSDALQAWGARARGVVVAWRMAVCVPMMKGAVASLISVRTSAVGMSVGGR
eukprot:2985213-Pleurochrysis_carterae.AAC.1